MELQVINFGKLMVISKLLLVFPDNPKSCAILKGSPSESRCVIGKYENNNGFICMIVHIKE